MRAAETVTVTARNSGGAASVAFAVTIVAAPVLTPPVSTVAPSLSGPGRVGTPMLVDTGVWSGVPAPVVTSRWRRNGVDISGAAGVEYTPVAADDGADLDCVVTASNASGTASAATGTVRIAYPAPAVAGALADLVLDQGQGARTLDASGAFAGASLAFDVAGAGASVDPATGLVSIPLNDVRAAETVTVTARNSGGAASVAFAVTIVAAPVLTPPVSTVAPSLSGPGRVGTPMLVDMGVWSGVPAPVVTSRWRRNGVDISGAAGVEYTPVAADDGADLDCVVTASNASGTASAATGTVRIAYPAPAVAGALADLVLDQGQGARTLDASGAFAGASLAFDVAGAGASVDPATGLVSIPLNDVRAAETVTVTARNSGGAASVAFAVTVVAADMTAPVLAGGALDVAVSPATLSATVGEGGTAFWMVDGAATRGAVEVEAGGGAAGGRFEVAAGATAVDVDLGALAPGAWILHLMVRDAAGNRSNVISTAFEFIPPVLVAPVLSGIAVTSGATQAVLSVSTDAADGALYWMVDMETARDAAEIRRGGGVASGSRGVVATGLQAQIVAEGLEPATRYHFHVMHEDAAGNRSAPLSTAFLMAAPSTGTARVVQSAVVVNDTAASSTPNYVGSSFSVGSGPGRALVAIVTGYSGSANTVPTDITAFFGGLPMIEVLAPAPGAYNRGWVGMYLLKAPPTGTDTLTASWSGVITRAAAITLVELEGVDQTVPTGASGSDFTFGTSIEFNVTATGGTVILSAVATNVGGRSAEFSVSADATMLRSGDTGTGANTDTSFAVASEVVAVTGPAGHGYAWPSPNDRASLAWLEIKGAA